LGTGFGIKEVLGPRRTEVLALLHDYGAKEVCIFGSVRRQEATEKSDVDFLVDGLPGASLLDVAHLKNELRKILRRPVDVVEAGDLPWAMRPQVEAEAARL
jgi:predicted nucleotidyltransferase